MSTNTNDNWEGGKMAEWQQNHPLPPRSCVLKNKISTARAMSDELNYKMQAGRPDQIDDTPAVRVRICECGKWVIFFLPFFYYLFFALGNCGVVMSWIYGYGYRSGGERLGILRFIFKGKFAFAFTALATGGSQVNRVKYETQGRKSKHGHVHLK